MNERQIVQPDPVSDKENESAIQYLIRHLGPNRHQQRANATGHMRKTKQQQMAERPKNNAKEIKATGRSISKKSRQDQISKQRKMDKAAKSRKDRAARK
jgi:hypothetical protein